MLCLVTGKFKGKYKEKKIERKKKDEGKKIKINKLFLYFTSNSFDLL